MENSGSKVLSIYMIDKDAVVGAIYVSEAGRISINDRPYKMKNAKQFQEQLEAIHCKMETLLGREGAWLDAIYYCPHHPDKGFPGERPELKIHRKSW